MMETSFGTMFHAREGPLIQDESILTMAIQESNSAEDSVPNDDGEDVVGLPKEDTGAAVIPVEPTMEINQDNVGSQAPAPNVVCNAESVDAEKKVATKKETLLENPKQVRRGTAGPPKSSTPGMQSLPMDALHSIASFLTPLEWCNEFGLVNKSVHAKASEIVRRVHLHAFKCATEVVAAWKLGQWEDARELAALYICHGVPIYPKCLGHSYHSVRWRMQTQADATRQAPETTAAADAAFGTSRTIPEAAAGVDPFFSGRTEFRAAQGNNREITYVEEKCLFANAGGGGTAHGAAPLGTGRRLVPPPPQPSGAAAPGNVATTTTTTQEQLHETRCGKTTVTIHQHLLDQHVLGEFTVNDNQGRMATPSTSLSADFFHPTARYARRASRSRAGSRTAAADASHNANSDHEDEDLEISNAMAVAENVWDPVPGGGNHGDLPPPPPPPPPLVDDRATDLAVFGAPVPQLSVVNSVDLQVYSSTTSSSSSKTVLSMENKARIDDNDDDDDDDSNDVKRHMRTRFATYQRRLEGFLAKSDMTGFDECMLDFWDEFFPHTAGVHYHDLETAVPRISCMHKFLTKPCPKAIGVVQCEIERIKIPSRGKGVNVTGRLFPTYEYRLFIRNRPLDAVGDNPENATSAEPEDFVRRDTVLMVAKNRGRKHAESNGVVPMSATSKKGSNNYYLYMPQQMDADAHFNKVNENLEKPARLVPNGASHSPILTSDDTSSVLLGRLQSNFIGTEFQIYTPRLRKLPRRKKEPLMSQAFCSEDELDYDSGGMSSDNASYRRSRFGRLVPRRTGSGAPITNPNPAHSDMSTGSNGSSTAVGRRAPVKRAMSSPDISHYQGGVGSGRQPRTNRRAIANDAQKEPPKSAWVEEEDGAITYTANLLGSRPRIMDVCIPKVTVESGAGGEWKRYLETCDDTDDCSMLSCFRQLQHRRDGLDNAQQNPPTGDDNDNNDIDSDTGDETEDFGLTALQNRPPWWNVELGSFVLNFGGRVSVASVKNFQLCERTNQDQIMLQFGRIKGRHSFTMDFQHPLTAVQAFSIAISSLQSKISFG